MLNIVALVGRIVSELEIKETPSGKKYLKFCVANTQGNQKSNFIDCLAWEQNAEFICKYYHKGDPISIEGRLEANIYQDSQGNKKKIMSVVVRSSEFLPNKKQDNSNYQKTQQPQQAKQTSMFSGNSNNNRFDDDAELPF